MSSSPSVDGPAAGHLLRGPQSACVARRPSSTPTCDARPQSQATGTPRPSAAGYAAGWARADKLRPGQQAEPTPPGHAEIARLAADAAAQARPRPRVSRALRRARPGRAAGWTRRVNPGSGRNWNTTVVDSAFTLAEAVIGRELAMRRDAGADAIARALAAVPTGGPVTVRLHPSGPRDHHRDTGVAGQTRRSRAEPCWSSPIRRCEPGDAVAECDATTVDARIAAALDRIREVLFGESAR